MTSWKRFRVYARAMARNKGVVSILAIALLAFGAELVIFHALWERSQSEAGSIREDAVWAAYQTDREAGRLIETLEHQLARPDETSLTQLTQRFDILYSRHEVMEETDFPSKFRNDPRLVGSTVAVGALLHRMLPSFDRIAATGAASREEIEATLSLARRVRSATDALLLATNQVQASLRVEEREEVRRIYAWLAFGVGILTVALGAVIVIIWRQVAALEIGRHRLQKLSEKLAQSAAAAEAGNKAKSTFLATMSHEIRTPLNGIVGMVELLAGTPLADEQREQLCTIRQCSDGLVALINDILDFSKLESGKIDLERRPTDLAEVVDGVVDLLAPRAEAKKLQLIATHPLAAYVTDPSRLRQILINLVGNAVKFTDRGTVAIDIVERRRSGDRTMLEVRIEDTGIGISQENQNRLFREFTQADPSINRRFGGSGLGLAITRRIVEAMDGTISVESREGEGTVFLFSIPVERVVVDAPPALPAGLSLEVTARAPLLAGALDRERAALGLTVHSAASGAQQRRIVVCDVAGFEAARAGGRLEAADDVLIVGTGARRHAAAATGVLDGAVTTRRLMRLLAQRLAGGAVRGAPSQPDGTAIGAIGARRGTVLVVEDNPVNRKVAVGLLERLGFSSEVAVNGREAVERMRDGGIDLVLMDMQMPEMDGLEATRRIRDDEATGGHRVPIVGLTANAFATDRSACFSAGMDDFVMKPVTCDRLAASLDRFVADLRPASADAVPPVATPAPTPAPAPAAASASVLDAAHRRLLGEVLGPEGLSELTAIFRADATDLSAEIERAFGAGDREALRRALHTLKGAAANVGAIALAAAVDEIRASGGLGEPAAVARLCAALLTTTEALVREELEAVEASDHTAVG